MTVVVSTSIATPSIAEIHTSHTIMNIAPRIPKVETVEGVPDQLCCQKNISLQNVGLYKTVYIYICIITYVNLVKTYLNEHISLYKMALGYLIIFLQYGRVLSAKIPFYNFEGSTR